MGLLLQNARLVDPSQGLDQAEDLLLEGGRLPKSGNICPQTAMRWWTPPDG